MKQNPKAIPNITWASIIKAFSVLAGILPAITNFIKEIESHEAPGADKKSAVLAFIEALLRGASAYTGQITDDIIAVVMQLANPLIDGIVAAYNAIGAFIHKDA